MYSNIFIFLGLLFMSFLFFIIPFAIKKEQTEKRKRCTAETIGNVMNYVIKRTKESDGTFYNYAYPKYSYTVNGQNYFVTSSISNGNKTIMREKYPIGSENKIFYNLTNPSDSFVAESFLPKWFFSIFYCISGFCLIIGIILLIV